MLCVEYYSEKGKGRIYSFLVNFFAREEKIFSRNQDISVRCYKYFYLWKYEAHWSGESAKSPVETGRFCRNGDIKK